MANNNNKKKLQPKFEVIEVELPSGESINLEIPANTPGSKMEAVINQAISDIEARGEIASTPIAEAALDKFLRKLGTFAGETGVPLAGAIAGAERGRRLLAPLGARGQLGGALIGAGIGGFTGALGGEAALGRDPSLQRAAETGIATSVGEILPGAAIAVKAPITAARQVIGRQAGRRTIAPTVREAISAPAPRRLGEPIERDLQRLAIESAQLGVPITRAARTGGTFVSTIENISRRALFGAKRRFQALDREANKAIQREFRRITKNLSNLPNDEARAALIQKSLSDADIAAGKFVGQAKGELFEKVGNNQVKLDPSDILPFKQELERGLRSLRGRETFGTSEAVINEILSRLEKSRLTIKDADTIISQIFDLTDSGAVTIGKGALKQVNRSLFRSIGKTAEQAGATKIFENYQLARTNFRNIQETLSKTAIEQISNSEFPELLGRLIARPGIGSRIGNLQQVLKPEAVNAARRSFLEFIVDKVTVGNVEDVSSGVVVSRRLLNELDRIGDDVLRKVFSARHLSDLKRVARVSKFANLTEELNLPENAQQVSLLSFGQGQALVAVAGFVGGGLIGGLRDQEVFFDRTTGALIAGGVLLGPAVAARVLANPKGVDLVTKLSRIPAARPTQESVVILNRLAALGARPTTDVQRKRRLEPIRP